MNQRASGVLLHPTCLPSPFGIGDLGRAAYDFIDVLAETKQRLWQILPLTPTATTAYNDPYHSISAFAGNPLLIGLDALVEDGLLEPSDIAAPPTFPEDHVDFEAVTAYKNGLFNKAFAAFTPDHDFHRFKAEQNGWLRDYALFAALKKKHGGSHWTTWPEGLRRRDPDALAVAREELDHDIRRTEFLQYIFDKQWKNVRRYLKAKGIQVFGDMPIYVDYDSVELWCRPDLWKLDKNLEQTCMAGVPPDYFSATGQLWESPIYDWKKHEAEGFDWWMRRIERNLELFDLLRIDHFRGLIAYWEVPAGEKTALNGEWVDVPFDAFFDAMFRRMPNPALVAEDLGVITADVREVMAKFNFPGMKILLFAFGPGMEKNPYIPHNIEKNAFVYTGTHDNNPVLGWWDEEATADDKKRLFSYLGREISREEAPWAMIRLAMLSPADMAVTPVHDLLGQGKEGRMNRPGNLKGNWDRRMGQDALTREILQKLKELTEISGRA